MMYAVRAHDGVGENVVRSISHEFGFEFNIENHKKVVRIWRIV